MLVLAVTWHFSYFPTGVAVEIRYQRTSPDSAKVHWARQELGAEWKKPMRVFSGSKQFLTWGIPESLILGVNIQRTLCVQEKLMHVAKKLTKQKHQEDQDEHQW